MSRVLLLPSCVIILNVFSPNDLLANIQTSLYSDSQTHTAPPPPPPQLAICLFHFHGNAQQNKWECLSLGK